MIDKNNALPVVRQAQQADQHITDH